MCVGVCLTVSDGLWFRKAPDVQLSGVCQLPFNSDRTRQSCHPWTPASQTDAPCVPGGSVTICFYQSLDEANDNSEFYFSARAWECVCAFVWTVSLCTYLKACHGSAGAQACDWVDCKWGGMTLTKNPTYFYHLSSHSEWRVMTTPSITFYKCCFIM